MLANGAKGQDKKTGDEGQNDQSHVKTVSLVGLTSGPLLPRPLPNCGWINPNRANFHSCIIFMFFFSYVDVTLKIIFALQNISRNFIFNKKTLQMLM
jgi:hypothetical protein